MDKVRVGAVLAAIGLLVSGTAYAEPLNLTNGVGVLLDERGSSPFQIANGGRWHQFDARPSTFIAFDVNPAAAAPVPEPATMVLIGTGLLGIARITRRRPQKTKT